MSVSLDGFAAGPDQSVEEPFGKGGEVLTEWQFETDLEGRSGDAEVLAEAGEGVGAFVMGRNMFGGGVGPWDESWTGWWGDEPPHHTPVFVLTHHAREPLPMKGGTTFSFVTRGIDAALEQARTAAGDRKVVVAGGASTVRQALVAGLIDELELHLVPVSLGAGERLLQDVGGLRLEPLRVVASPTVTHVKYRVTRE